MTCDYTPPLVEQLHGPDPTAGSDCAVACAKMAIRFATCGALDPSLDAIRQQANLDEGPDYSLTITEYQKAVNAFDDEAQRAGYEGIGAGVHERQNWENDLAPVIRAEAKWCTVYVDYTIVNQRHPDLSGDKDFGGAHAVGAYGFTPAEDSGNGQARVRIFDPLNDGRSASIPKGPVWWNMSTLRDAADAYAGGASGNATWCVTPRAERADGTEPAPDPCAVAVVDAGFLLGELRTHLYQHGGQAVSDLAARINAYLGGNPEGLALPVHSGVTPDDDGS